MARSFRFLSEWWISGGTVFVCDWNRELVWNRIVSGKGRCDSGSGDGFYFLSNLRRDGTDFCALHHINFPKLLCDVFEYCNAAS